MRTPTAFLDSTSFNYKCTDVRINFIFMYFPSFTMDHKLESVIPSLPSIFRYLIELMAVDIYLAVAAKEILGWRWEILKGIDTAIPSNR